MMWRYHLGPGIDVDEVAAGACRAMDEEKRALFTMACSRADISMQVRRAQEAPACGWYSRTSATLVPVSVVGWVVVASLPYECEFVIRLDTAREHSCASEDQGRVQD